ncbi:alpha/beta hydrolase [Novosphingobium bradum]|uniref:Alpha/beta hydrolase n=1 Tax=Novosphingobium bradum TaxID=1737444 RepID=A0ABV7ITI1_9SPHN
MKFRHALAFALAAAPVPVAAQLAVPPQGSATPPAGSAAIPLYGKDTPGSPRDEVETRFMGRETVIRNITYPTLTPILPAPGKANGAAVLVLAGGGFQMLSLQNEGWRVAQALADHGVAAFVVKYRLNPSERDDKAWMATMARLMGGASPAGKAGKPPEIREPRATDDALAALRVVRARAGEWGVDPRRVGMIGFSAGAITTLNAVLQATDRQPGPDFIGYIYGPMAAVTVPAGAPPMFAALAMDDPLFGNGDFSIVSAWHAAKKPVELHAYAGGSHGFGMGTPGTTSTLMMSQFLAWMQSRGLLEAKARP